MNVKFTHYLITRFNVPVNNWHTDKYGKRVLDDQWLENRLDLFTNYCLPTIIRQREKSFKWLIYCDLNSNHIFLDVLKKRLMNLPLAQIVLVSDFDHLVEDLRQRISSLETPYVITSRLDNDDGIGPDFIADVQKHFIAQDGRILNFTKGVLYDVYKKVLTEIRDSRRNHYGSLIEQTKPADQLLTVVGYPHGIPPEGYEIEDITTRFSWLKIIHERNMVSKTNGVPMSSKSLSDHFGLSPDVLPVSWLQTVVFIFRRLLSKAKRMLIGAK